MNEEQKEEMEEMLRTNEKLFAGFLLLKSHIRLKRNRKDRAELNIIFENYAFLLSERKNYAEMEKRLKAINGFMGLR